MSILSFEWGISDPDEQGLVMVRCRIEGTEHTKLWGPMPAKIAPSFLRAKRDALSRSMRTRAQAIQLFTSPEPRLLQ